jgi:hypothetical protein
MPKISEFFGISIYMFHREHFPPHFHAIYGGEEAVVSINDLSLLTGRLPPRVMGMVIEWGSLHQEELRQDWTKVLAHDPLDTIEPLK